MSCWRIFMVLAIAAVLQFNEEPVSARSSAVQNTAIRNSDTRSRHPRRSTNQKDVVTQNGNGGGGGVGDDSTDGMDEEEQGNDDSSGPCPPPSLSLNGTETENVVGEGRFREDYTHIREVKFSSPIGPLGEKRFCKIKCIRGQWVGPLCLDHQGDGRFQPLYRDCKLDHLNRHLIITFRNLTVDTAGWEFPHGAKVLIRCREMGLYKLVGTNVLHCENGVWSSLQPSCVPTTLLANFSGDAPPSILIHIPSGSASVEATGHLALFPGSTVHLECLFSRRLGSPEWTWTCPQGQYLTGWAIAAEERDWKYRLSIYYAKKEDSCTFTCTSPKGITNSLTLQVAAVHCRPISVSGAQHLSAIVQGNRLGQSAIFRCPKGFRVNGASNLTCQVSGKWSSNVPTCEVVKCPTLDLPNRLTEPHLQLEEHNNTYGGRSVFSCAWGYRLMGPPGIECLLDGNWSDPLPKCVPVQCPPPPYENDEFLSMSETAGMDGEQYAVGTLVQFNCRDAHLLEGEPSIICTETGAWSHPFPICKPRCPYLGEPNNGLVAPTKFAYEPGDELQIICNPGFEARLEEARPRCLLDGSWSSPLPNCTNYSQI